MKKASLIVCLVLCLAAFYAGNRYTAELVGIPGMWLFNMEAAYDAALASVAARPFHLSLGQWPLLIGLCCFITVLSVWSYALLVPKPERVGEEYGSARWGTVAEARKFRARGRKAVVVLEPLAKKKQTEGTRA